VPSAEPIPNQHVEDADSGEQVYAWTVRTRIVDGERWIVERMKFLRELLASELSDEERKAAEAELETLSRERGFTVRGHRVPRILRLLRRKS